MHGVRFPCKTDGSEGLMGERKRKEDHPLYSTWKSMKSRCYNPNRRDYRYYGGRGIGVCDSWIKSFERFVEDMGERPEGHTLDREDNDKGYFKLPVGREEGAVAEPTLLQTKPSRRKAHLFPQGVIYCKGILFW